MTSTVELHDNGLFKRIGTDLAAKLPKVFRNALNSLAFDAMRDLKDEEKRKLHLTRPFLPNSTQVEKATDTNFVATVGLLDRVKFGERLIEGGERHPIDSKYIAIPLAGVRRTAKGGVPRSQRPSELLKNPNVFFTDIDGTPFLMQRTRDGDAKPLYVLKSRTDYGDAPYFDFEGAAERATDDFEQALGTAFIKAI